MADTLWHTFHGTDGHRSEYAGSLGNNLGAVGLDGIGHMCLCMDVHIRPTVCRTALGKATRPDLGNILSMKDDRRWANAFEILFGICIATDPRGIPV
jgi:hypothetical protein